METAETLASVYGIAARIRDSLGEFRFGEWEGKSFDELDRDPEWRRFNTSRSLARPPGGELMIEVQRRMIEELDDIQREHQGEIIAVVSHCDPLRAALAYYLGTPLDLISRFEISPASVSVVRFRDGVPQVACLNFAEASLR
jgi:broad specificity phosphatase PhoE